MLGSIKIWFGYDICGGKTILKRPSHSFNSNESALVMPWAHLCNHLSQNDTPWSGMDTTACKTKSWIKECEGLAWGRPTFDMPQKTSISNGR